MSEPEGSRRPLTSRSRFLVPFGAKEFLLFGASTALYQASRFVFSLAAAHSLAPGAFTAWALVIAVLIYAPSLLVGVVNGVGREMPLLTGSGRKGDAARAETAGWTSAVVVGVVVITASLIIATLVPSSSAAAVLVGLLVVGSVFYHTQQLVLRSRLLFNAASIQQASFGMVGLVVAPILIVVAPTGFAVCASLYGTALLIGIATGLVAHRPPRLEIDRREIRRLVSIGFPIMLAGLIFSFFVTLDRWFAIAILGAVRASPYALASLIAAAMLVVPAVVSQQTYPRMAIARGQGAPASALREMARHQGVIAAILVAPVALFIGAFAAFGLPILLPAYVSAAPAIAVLSLGFVVLAGLAGYGNYLNVVGAQWQYLRVQLIAVLIAAILMTIGGLGLGLTGIAAGMSLGHFAYGLLLRRAASRTDAPRIDPASAAPPGTADYPVTEISESLMRAHDT